MLLGEAGERQHIQAFLGLTGEIHQNHAHDVTGMPVTMAGDDHAVAVDFFSRPADQIHGHFCPEGKRLFRAKLKAVLSNADVVRGEAKLGPIFLQFERLENPRGI